MEEQSTEVDDISLMNKNSISILILIGLNVSLKMTRDVNFNYIFTKLCKILVLNNQLTDK